MNANVMSWQYEKCDIFLEKALSNMWQFKRGSIVAGLELDESSSVQFSSPDKCSLAAQFIPSTGYNH